MLLPFDTIERTVDFDARANDMALRPWQWEFLLAADGRTRLADLAHLCGIDFETAADLTRETEALGLVGIVTLSLDAYRASVAALVRPVAAVAPPTALFDESSAVALSYDAPSEAPLPLAAPRKPVSVSFDSFSTMLEDGWDTPDPVVDAPHHEPFAFAEPAPREPFAHNGSVVFPDDIFSHEDFPIERTAHDSFPHETPHDALPGDDALAESPLLDTMPIDFEFPDHMVPLADRATHDSGSTNHDSDADLFAEAPTRNDIHENGTTVHAEDAFFEVAHAVDETPAHVATHVEFSPNGDALLDATHVEPYEPVTHDEFIDVMSAYEPSAPSVGEHHDESTRDPFAPLQPFVEPVVAPVTAKKSVSFSLSADSFGLPNVPTGGMNFDAHSFDEPSDFEAPHEIVRYDEATAVGESQVHETVIAHEAPSDSEIQYEPAHPEPTAVVAPKKDDVLLQHFHVAGAAGTANGTTGTGSAATSDLRNEDLTGVFLRVLGLKK